MHRHSWLWEYLWLAPGILQLILFAFLLARKLHREFPLFCLYTGFNAVAIITLFGLDHSPSISGHQYWSTQVAVDFISALLRFTIVYEIFQHVFRPYDSLRRMASRLLEIAFAVLLAAGVAIAFYGPAENADRLLAGMNVMLRTASFVQCGVVVILFLFCCYFGLSWRSYVFAIALGLGVYANAQLVVAAISAQNASSSKAYVGDFISFGAYHISVLIWIGYLFRKDPVWRTVRAVPNNDLETWNHELERLLQR